MRAKSRLGLYALALLAAALIVVARLPAKYLAGRFLPTNNLLQIGGVNGSLWAGESYGLRWRSRPLGVLRWRFAPGFGPAWQVELSGAGISARARLSPVADGFKADDLIGVWPIERLEHGLEGVALGGEVHAAISHLSFTSARLMALDGRLEWRAARLAAPVQLKLGTVVVDLKTIGAGRIAINAGSTGPAEVNLRGSGAIERGSYTLIAHLKALTPAGATWLAALGEPQPDGTVRVSLTGNL